MNVTVYNSASFVCIAHGYGSIKIVWKRVNYTLPITADVTVEESLNQFTSTLRISEIVGYYSGQYYCFAENKAGKAISQVANLHVQKSRGYNCCVIHSYTYVISNITICLLAS